jgi:hypothetical protein
MQRRYHYERVARTPRPREEVFAELDDIGALARHMSQRSAATFGAHLSLSTLRSSPGVGARYRWDGRVLGLTIEAVEEVTIHEPPRLKRWCTIGTPRLLVIGGYCIELELTETGDGGAIRIRIDYDLPAAGWQRFAGRLLGHAYARWCVDRMVEDAVAT